ncbi:haloacid dehalogenase-like hydrolase [Wenzhouxiangella sp. AB-CW3]|nr:haloacid dehalogenase-like hydrolase [Wenzhouxiangella sp. AB-CW3]
MDCALVYDFDGTLAAGNCAEHGLFPALGIEDADAFWSNVTAQAKERDGEQILTYLGELALAARNADRKEELRPERLRIHGAEIKLFPGVRDWFQRIDAFAAKQGLNIAHFIVSSGLEDMILGTPIAHHFRQVFACRYHYDQDTGHAKWPSVAINYTTKTQYLFRINKGIANRWDDAAVNQYIEADQRPFPFRRMIYFGDGDTDIPSMKLVKQQGGFSLAVFDENHWQKKTTRDKIGKLIAEDRVSYVVPGNYTRGSQLDVTVKGLLQLFRRKT